MWLSNLLLLEITRGNLNTAAAQVTSVLQRIRSRMYPISHLSFKKDVYPFVSVFCK